MLTLIDTDGDPGDGGLLIVGDGYGDNNQQRIEAAINQLTVMLGASSRCIVMVERGVVKRDVSDENPWLIS